MSIGEHDVHAVLRKQHRKLAFADEVTGDGPDVTRLNLCLLELGQGHDAEALCLADELLARVESPLGRALTHHARAIALHALHRHGEARLAAEEAARALTGVGKTQLAAESAALARLSRQFALLHRLPRWLLDHTQTDQAPGARWSRWRRRAHALLVTANAALLGLAVTLGWLAPSAVARVAVVVVAAALVLAEARELVGYRRDVRLLDRPEAPER